MPCRYGWVLRWAWTKRGGHKTKAQLAQKVSLQRPTIERVCSACWALYFLVPMLFELGLGKLLSRRARLALDEPKA